MRPVLVLFLLVGTTGTLSAKTPPQKTESDLARAYYQAVKADDFGKANAALQELSDRFPDDDLTKLVADHWNRHLQEAGAKNWKEIRTKRIRNRDQEKFVTSVYQIADMIVPVVPKGKSSPETNRNAKVFTKMVAETMKEIAEHEGTPKEGTEVTYHPKTLSLVVRAPRSLHSKLEALLTQMRRQQDLQITYDVKIVSVPAEIANRWALQETLSPNEFKKRMELAEQGNQLEVMMSPKLTTFDGQIARISTDFSSISLHGRISEDRRLTRMEIMLGIDSKAGTPNWIISASETIPDGQTGVFFVRSEDAPSRQLDRRLLIEKGIDVAPSTANQLFALITPRIIIMEEEEELLGLPEVSATSTNKPSGRPPVQGWPASATSPSLPAYAWPSYGATYPSFPGPSGWTPVKLEWDDGHWNLNFDTDSKKIKKTFTTPKIIREEEELLGLPEKRTSSTKFPWARRPVPSPPTFATFPSFPVATLPSYESTCAAMPPEYLEKHPKLNMDDWNWDPNLDAVNENGQRVIDAWDLNGTSRRLRYRNDAENPLLKFTP